ncbi:uncharacterized protein [Gossypium hirsutum]|uniref:DUF7745 domain-containing protein n=1 Tax=Gossypium hirsutum TaxID=3635 RepID=A0ABM2YNF9_GOSHI|nr:uncharacterized protein LOC121205976 [Gossypium hirsutum]
MESEFLDKVEDNAAIRMWSEKMQLEKGDSLAEGYTSGLSGFTRINVDKYLFRAMAQFWNPAYSCFTFEKVDLVPTVEEYTALLRCPKVQVDKVYCKAASAPAFVKKLMSITGMSEQWVIAQIQQKGDGRCIPWVSLRDLIVAPPDTKRKVDVFTFSIYGLVIFPKALRHIDEVVADFFDRLDKGITPVPAVLAETFRSLSACRRANEGRFIGCTQLLLAWFHSHFWKVDKVSYRVFSESYSPLKEIAAMSRRDDISEENWIALLQNLQEKDVEWGAHWSRQFIPMTHGLAQSEFAYREKNYKKKVQEISDVWKQTRRIKRLAVGSMTTPEYNGWLSKRVNDNIPEPSLEDVRTMEEYFALKKRLAEGQGEKEKLEARVAKLEKALHQHRGRNSDIELNASLNRIEDLKGKVEELETALQNCELRIELLESNNEQWKEQLHRSQDQVRDKDHIMGEAVAQIREVADYLQTLAVQADVLTVKYELESDQGCELAYLLKKVKALSIRAKLYM